MSKHKSEMRRPKLVVRQRKATVARTSSSHTNRYGQPKVSFLTREGASASAARSCHGAGTPSVYVCDTCGLWHIGGRRP